MICIAYNYNNFPISIVNAKSLELANAYWHGANIIPHSTKTLKDFISLDEHPTGVIPILKTKESSVYEFKNSNSDQKILIISK